MDYTVTRSNRKTVGLYITKDAKLEIRAPIYVTEAEISRIVDSKAAWIEKHMTQKKEQLVKKSLFALDYGKKVLFRGEYYPITKSEEGIGFSGNEFLIPGDLDAEQIKNVMIRIYKQLAADIIVLKAYEYASCMNVTPAAIHINSAKTRWGSCSGKNSLNFSWRLVLGGDNLIDYVVVHELAHIVHHNHSRDFWKTVEAVMPDYHTREYEMKQFAITLSEQDW